MISAVYRVLNPMELLYCWKVGGSCAVWRLSCSAPDRPSPCSNYGLCCVLCRLTTCVRQGLYTRLFFWHLRAPPVSGQVSLFDFVLYIVTFCVVIFAGVYW